MYSNLQPGFVSSHFFFRFLQVMHPVFDLPFASFAIDSAVALGCFLGRPRGTLTLVGIVEETDKASGITLFFTSDTSESSAISISSAGSSFGTKSKPSSAQLKSAISSCRSTNPDELQGSVPDDVVEVAIVNADEDDTSKPLMLLDSIVNMSNSRYLFARRFDMCSRRRIVSLIERI
jgi:hypothetical protein